MSALIILIWSTLSLAACPDTQPSGSRCVDTGVTLEITAHSACRRITNSHASSKGLMVPINTSTEWTTFYGSPPAGVTIATCTDPCSATPTPGTVCSDGSVYAGLSPDGNVPMYVAFCDIGKTQSGSLCTGTSTNIAWASGATIATGYTSSVTGRANSIGLAALVNADAPYTAASTCRSLNQHGRTDWYLPAQDELSAIRASYAANGNFANFTDTNFYWSSTELNTTTPLRLRFNTNTVGNNTSKTSVYPVRCVRRD